MTYHYEETQDEERFDYKTEPFPDNAIDCEQHKQDLIATIIMLRDQIDAVHNGDAAAKHDKWVYGATSFRHIVQKRLNRLYAHMSRMMVTQKEEETRALHAAAVKRAEMAAAFEYMITKAPEHLEGFNSAVNEAKDGVTQ